MYRYSIPKLFRSLFPAGLLATAVLLGGCVADKQMIPPYQGKVQREAAMQQPGYERPIVEEPLPASYTPETSSPGRQILADEDLLLPILTHINERIFSYEQKLAARKLQDMNVELSDSAGQSDTVNDCRQQIQDILDQYNELHMKLLQEDLVTTGYLFKGETLLNLEKQDFQFLESDCNTNTLKDGELAVSSGLPAGQVLSGQKAREISAAFANGEFERTIQEYEALLADTFQDQPYDVTLAYGKALMKTGREADSRKVFNDLLSRIRQNDQALWEFQLMQLIGDLDFALGTYDSARTRYDDIVRTYEDLRGKSDWAKQQLSALNVADEQSDEVKAYAELLRSHLAYNPDRDGFTVVRKAEDFVNMYPYSLVASSADQLVILNREKAEQWYRNLLQQVNELAAKENFQEALLVLEKVPRTILPLEKQQELAAKSTELSTTEAITRETRELAQEQQLQEDWNAGMTFLELKQYDQAIEAFSRLQGSSYDARAMERINEAADLAAQEDRKRAAELFVRSNRTHDLESRKKLLLSSRQLLQDILIKYPQSDLIEKVKRNLQRIDKEINTIDPALLSKPVTVNGLITDPADLSGQVISDQPQGRNEMNVQPVIE